MSARTSLSNAGAGAQVPPQRVLVFGCGYLGRRVAHLAVRRGDQVWGTTRRDSRAAELDESGIRPLVVDWTEARTLTGLPEVDRVLVAVSYDRGSRRSRYESQVEGFRNLLAAVSPRADLCYISTTGVYHQADGSWVDERSPARPRREGGRVHLQAENLLRRLRPRSSWSVLRLAGIYGPGRVPRAADVLAGRPIASAAEGFLNLIHVQDAARAVIHYWDRRSERGDTGDPSAPGPSRLYVVADDEPVVRKEFYREIARQCHVPEPSFISQGSDEPLSARSESNKRVWNRRLKRELLPRLSYPSYREGLAEILNT